MNELAAAGGRHAEIARRYSKRQPNRPPVTITALRIAELKRLFTSRHGHTLPDTDAGRDAVLVMAHHLAHRYADAARYIGNSIGLRAPWMRADESAEIIRRVVARPIKWRADKLAQLLRVTEAERRRLGIRTIGAVDVSKEEREQARRRRQRQRERARRRTQGVKPRAEYETNSVSRTKPWLAEGISRRTWYRRRGTSPRAI